MLHPPARRRLGEWEALAREPVRRASTVETRRQQGVRWSVRRAVQPSPCAWPEQGVSGTRPRDGGPPIRIAPSRRPSRANCRSAPARSRRRCRNWLPGARDRGRHLRLSAPLEGELKMGQLDVVVAAAGTRPLPCALPAPGLLPAPLSKTSHRPRRVEPTPGQARSNEPSYPPVTITARRPHRPA